MAKAKKRFKDNNDDEMREVNLTPQQTTNLKHDFHIYLSTIVQNQEKTEKKPPIIDVRKIDYLSS